MAARPNRRHRSGKCQFLDGDAVLEIALARIGSKRVLYGERFTNKSTPAVASRLLLAGGFSFTFDKLNGSCQKMAAKMYARGTEGCQKHRAEIIEHLRTSYKETSTAEVWAAVANSVTTGLAFKLNPLDPFGSLVDEAIRRAEASDVL